jgi:hypothetical protein
VNDGGGDCGSGISSGHFTNGYFSFV